MAGKKKDEPAHVTSEPKPQPSRGETELMMLGERMANLAEWARHYKQRLNYGVGDLVQPFDFMATKQGPFICLEIIEAGPTPPERQNVRLGIIAPDGQLICYWVEDWTQTKWTPSNGAVAQ